MKLKFNFIAITLMLMGMGAMAQDTIKTSTEAMPAIDTSAIAKENIQQMDTIVEKEILKTTEKAEDGIDATPAIANDTAAKVETIVEEAEIDSAALLEQKLEEIKEAYTKDSMKIAMEDTIAKVGKESIADTIELHIGDIAKNYNLKREFIEDSNALKTYLAKQQQDFAELKQLCQQIATNTRTMIADLDLDYRDGLVWLDTNLVINNYDQERRVLQRLAAQADNMKEHYLILEEERIAKEKRLAEMRAQEEARRRQIAQNNRLANVHEEIATHHHTINSICNATNVGDKARQKTMKDLFYAYLSVYNKYDITTAEASDRLLAENNELNNFQQNLIDSVLSENSYLTRINSFKESLKEASGREYSNVYKSYSRLFKRTTVAINFSTIEEYTKYTDELREILNTQQLYRLSIDEQRTIDQNSDTIHAKFSKKYRDETSAYKDVVAGIDFTPNFLNSIEGGKYIDRLHEFQEVQQWYMYNFSRLDTIGWKGEEIIEKCPKENSDVATAYKELLGRTSFVATFNNLEGAGLYTEKLNNFETMQDQYTLTIEMRQTISEQLRQIQEKKSIDKVLATGYKNIKKVSVLTPQFSTVAQGDAFLNVLSEHIALQEDFLRTIDRQDTLNQNREEIFKSTKLYKNINRAYKKINKSYDTSKTIVSNQDFEQYKNIQRRHLTIQEKILNILRGANAADVDQQLRHAGDVENIKLVIQAQ